jgi:Xaa-Pro dipeptidase
MAIQPEPGRGEAFPRFSAGEYERRNRAVRDAMDREGLDALMIYGGAGSPEICYLTNYLPVMSCWLLFPREGEPVVFIHFFNHVPCTKEMSVIDDVRCYGPSPTATLAAEMHARVLTGAKVGMVSLNSIPYNQFNDLKTRLPDATFVEFGRGYNDIRWVRSEEELQFVRRSGYLTDLACEALEHELRPGLTEYDIRSIVCNSYNGHESDPGIHFIATTSMAAPDRFVPWQRMTPRTLRKGDVVITELTVTYWGYSTQIHRPFAIGQEPTSLYVELFDAALACYENIRRICQPGTTSEQIVAASGVIEERGFTSYDSVFHGERGKSPELGTASAAHPLEPWTLRENMIHVIQPNPATRDLTAGLQLGSAVVIKPGGGEPLHNYPFKFSVCGA